MKADRDKELTSQRDRVRKYLKEVARLIRLQKGIRARTEGGDELRGLGEDQQRVASDTGKLGGDIAETEVDKEDRATKAKNDDERRRQEQDDERQEATMPRRAETEIGDEQTEASESKPGDPASRPTASRPKSQPERRQAIRRPAVGAESIASRRIPSQSQGQPGSPSSRRERARASSNRASRKTRPSERPSGLRDAQQQMEEARKKLKEAERKGAADEQREALKELEQAKAELERVLRQLREEELERTLTQLAARFRKMLELQNAVYEGTVRLDRVPEAERDHDDEIEAARLSRQESQIVHEADKALLLLREEGSSVAFPEAVEQMRDDMQQVAERLAAVKVGDDHARPGAGHHRRARGDDRGAGKGDQGFGKESHAARPAAGRRPAGRAAAGRQAGRAEDDPLAANADQPAHPAIRRNDRGRAGRDGRAAGGLEGPGRAAAACLPGHGRFEQGRND